ncbi:MAG TPA: hypothetical protein VFG22_13215 [Polyangiales bacterium]|nr:hypothetical protein [Polyangiales bacterium]
MSEDDLSAASRESEAPSFDFDEDAIATLLDTFVETRTGPQAKRVSRPPDPSDSGAQAAQRTVFQVRSRDESLPLVGERPEAKKRRIELLEALAGRAVGSAKARLLTSAAELHERLGNAEAAERDYQMALGADARDVVVVRAMRRCAMNREDWPAAADALEKEAGLELSSSERGSALKLLASIQLWKLRDPAAGEQAASHAVALRDEDFSALVLLASARMARGDAGGAADALSSAAEHWPQSEARGLIHLHAAELMEDAGALESAQRAYQRVLELSPSRLAAHLGVVRVSRALGAWEPAIEALHQAAEVAPAPVAAALLRTAACVRMRTGGPKELVTLLEGAVDVASRWTLAEAAALANELERAIEAFDSDVPGLSPEARTMSSARRARFHAELQDPARFERAASESGSARSLTPYLRACHRLLSSNEEDEGRLRRMLETVSDEASSPSSRMVRADDAARDGNGARFFQALEHELDEAPDHLAAGAALAWVEMAEHSARIDHRSALLRAEERMPQNPLIAQALLLDDDDVSANARRWSNAGRATEGDRRAFAFTMAARLASPETEAAMGASDEALAASTDYWPTLWELEDQIGTPDARAASAVRQAELDAANEIPDMLRASMWTTSASKRLELAAATLDRAAPDPLLLEHLFDAAGTSSEAAGDLMMLAADRMAGLPYFERAADSYRLAGLPSQAAKVLRAASAKRPEDPMIRVQRKDAELEACEFARLADSAMRRAREARTDEEELGAFADMAEVDRLARRDMQSARLALQSIAESRPDHIPTARALEWDALRENDTERIRSSARRLLEILPADSAERLARQRLILESLSSDPDIMRIDLDRQLGRIEEPLAADPGLARQVLGAAYAGSQPLRCVPALEALRSTLGDELEEGAVALDTARVLERIGDHERALQTLDAAGSHPLARESEARLLHTAKRWEEAAATYRDAATRAKDSHRAAALWREAACILEEELGNLDAAVDAWVAAANCDIRYLDVYRRLAALYRRQGELDRLASLTDRRIDAGADTPTLVSLLVDKARQRRERGDLEGVIAALDECLELDPHHFAALKELVDTHRGAEDWQGAAEALIRIARLKRSVEEQSWAFTQLAEIYDVHLHDLSRAEASLRQVAKLAPTHLETLDRLASVLSRENKALEAARLLEELIRRTTGETELRDYRIRLAVAVESAGQPRQAELLLESLRAEQPTEIDVILAAADHYQRQGAAPAEAMHLNRAVTDLRSAIDADPGSEALWTTLVRVLHRRHGPGPASCAASAAIALGHPASLFDGDVSRQNEALGEPKVPMSKLVDSIVAPVGLPQTLRRLFALSEQSFDKALPFDASAWHLRRPSGPFMSLVEEAGAVAEALGISEPRLRVTHVAPAACMPVSGDPPTIVVGGKLHEITSARERVFLFARALKVASNHLAPALRARPEELDVALLALLQAHDASRGEHPRARELQDLRKKLLKSVPRRWRDEVESLVLELRGNASFSTRSVPMAISELGDRAALTLTGDVPSAVDALLKIAGHDVPASDSGRLGAILENREAWAMVRFAIADAHFEARAQAGVDP